MELISVCPNCKCNTFLPFLECIDYTVSKEVFKIVSCTVCNFKITNPRPDAQQIGKYYDSPDYISHSSTKKGLINKVYHIVKRRAICGKINILNSLNPVSKDILDIGSGAGSFLEAITKEGWHAKGVEPDEKTRNFSKELGISVTDENYLKTTQERFAIITMWHVLEHVHNLNDRITEIQRLLKPGGYACIAVPNYNSADAAHYGSYWAGYDVPRHLYHFSADTIKSLFAKQDLKFIKSLPMKMDSFYVSMLSEKYKGSSLQMVRALLNGFKSNLKAGRNAEMYSSVIYIFNKQ